MRFFKLFLDLDGVLADMDKHFAELAGIKASEMAWTEHEKFWAIVHKDPDFFSNLEKTPDCDYLWHRTAALGPTILTGLPRINKYDYAQQKKDWVAKHFGKEVPVIVCPSKEKIIHAWSVTPVDWVPVLIDDWLKYKEIWETGRGHFIHHTDAVSSVNALQTFIKAL